MAPGGLRKAVHSSVRIEENGHGEGRDLVSVDWKTRSGKAVGQVLVPVTGKGRTGPVSLLLACVGGASQIPYTAGSIPNCGEWDTREWQWWKGLSLNFIDQIQMRPRYHSTTVGGVDQGAGGIRVWSQFSCDDVTTTQEWFFSDLRDEDSAIYDCLITVRNDRKDTLDEYGQFFACYTAWNELVKTPVWDQTKRQWTPSRTGLGHFYWSFDGELVNYLDKGGSHLDFYVVAKGSPFEKLGYIPHCPHGEGKVRDTWRHPVSVSQPGPGGYRHIVLCEEAATSAVACGMQGVAQDYLIYPPSGAFKSGDTFRVHVRHLVVRASPDELPGKLESWWRDFTADHERIESLSRPVIGK
jgi:hypothetical protein